MILRELPCFRGFRCLAGTCPDTCCAGWAIDLDPETLARYAALPGTLGAEIREAICREDGYTFFGLRQGRCPFLNGDNLCRLILEQGEEMLSVTCREHPRFWADFGDLREVSLAISCPEAARLLLGEPVTVTSRIIEETAPEDPELDGALLALLEGFRERLMARCQTDGPLRDRMEAVLTLGRHEDGLLLRWGAGEDVADIPEPEPAPWKLDLPGFFRVLGEMDCTDRRLPWRLARCRPREWKPDALAVPEGRLMAYFLYRYTLRAVWDGWLWEKVAFSVYAAAAIGCLAETFRGEPEARLRQAAVLFSREVEHSEDNLRMLFRFLRPLCE